MARIYPSSLIISFTGRFSGSVFERSHGVNFIRTHINAPLKSKSQKQYSLRGIRSTLSGLWFPLSPTIKSLWRSYSVVSRSASSGYHSFLDINTRLYYLLGQSSYRLSPPPFPSTPTHVSGISGSDLSNGSFNISWLKPSSSSSFIICNYRPVLSHYKVISTGWKFGFTSDSISLNKTINTGYESTRLVDFRLRSFDSYGRVSPWSNTFRLSVTPSIIYGGTYPGGKLIKWNGSNAWVEVATGIESQQRINSLVSFQDTIFGGTGMNGLLFKWNKATSWIKVASYLGPLAQIHDMAIYNGNIYGTTSPTACLYLWNGTNAWVKVAPQYLGMADAWSIAVFNNEIFGGMGYFSYLFKWNGSDAWIKVADPVTTSYSHGARKLIVFKNNLYCGIASYTFQALGGALYKWNGTNAWVQVAPRLGVEYQIQSLVILNDELFAGTFPHGKLYKWNGVNAWIQMAPQLGAETSILSMVVLNGKIYGGTAPNGKLYRWNGTNAWESVAEKLGSETYIFSLLVF